MISPVHNDVHAGPKAQEAAPYDLDKFLSLDLIRSHTKTDDVPAVSDVMLELYRNAALEAAEEYTGLLLKARRVVVESVRPPGVTGHKTYRKMEFVHSTEHVISDPLVWYYGHRSQPPIQIHADTNTTRLVLPRVHSDFGLGCCNPCGGEAFSRVQYVAGLTCLTEAPAVIKLGALKYIAHVIENPGDLVRTSNAGGGSSSGSASVGEASNPAWASGAIEIWRLVRRDAV